MRPRIAPSLLSADFARLGEAVAACEAASVEWIHFDVMDGRFVPNLTVGPIVLTALRRVTKISFDVHLMIEEPSRSIDQYLDAGAGRVAFHVEAEPHLHRLVQHVRSRGASPGVAINPGTSLSALDEALHVADYILVMSVNPGWGGQAFIPRALERIAWVAARAREIGRDVEIAVDGGVTRDNAGRLVLAGASHLIAGSSVFGSADVPGAVAGLLASASAPNLPRGQGM